MLLTIRSLYTNSFLLRRGSHEGENLARFLAEHEASAMLLRELHGPNARLTGFNKPSRGIKQAGKAFTPLPSIKRVRLLFSLTLSEVEWGPCLTSVISNNELGRSKTFIRNIL